MANPLSDDFTLPLGGTSYRFRFGLREVIDMQERLVSGTDVPTVKDIDQGIRSGRLSYVRAMLWAGLQQFQPQTTLDDVTNLMASASEPEMSAVFTAFGYSVRPDPEDVVALGIEAPAENPQPAQDQTTGVDSTSTLAGVA